MFEDKTGHPVSNEDIEEAIYVCTQVMVKKILQLPPELAVQLPNIVRCLKEFSAARKAGSL